MERPVRILVVDNLAVESVRREVYRAVARIFGVEVHLLVPWRWKETREAVSCEPEQGNEIRVYPSRIAFGFRHQRVLYLDLPRVLQHVKPDFILAVAQPESYAAAQVCINSRLYARKAKLGFFSSRNIDYPREGFPYKLKFTHRMCDAITRMSGPEISFYRPEAAGKLLAPYAKRLVYAPHVVDCTLFRKYKSEAVSGGEKRIVIGYVGRLVREKGLYVLLEALRNLPGPVRLLTIGEGPEEKHLRRLAAECGLADRVEFCPPVPHAEVPAMLNMLDVLALPSLETAKWTELFGRVLIEGMACEVPIVASRSGGIPEVVGDAGTLVSPGDSAALAAALDHLSCNPSVRCALGRKGRERALQHFDVPVVASLLGKEIMDSVTRVDAKVHMT